MLREDKAVIIKNICDVFAGGNTVAVIKNEGVDSVEIKQVRLSFKSAGVGLISTKNSLLEVAAKRSSFDASIYNGLCGANMLAFSPDPFLLFRSVFGSIANSEKLKISSVYVDNVLLHSDSVQMMSECASVRDLQVRICKCLLSSISGFCFAGKALSVKTARVFSARISKSEFSSDT